MDFKRARSNEQINDRQNEIINACRILFSNCDYDSITFGKISEMTSISRPSIYNYYNTKEKILLDLLKAEYLNLFNTLNFLYNSKKYITRKDFCNLIVDCLNDSDIFLKLLSIDYIIERNCSFEKLTQFKISIQPIFNLLYEIVDNIFPRANSIDKNNFVFMFFSSIGNIYVSANPTEKQVKSTKIANRNYNFPDFKNICYKYILLISSNL